MSPCQCACLLNFLHMCVFWDVWPSYTAALFSFLFARSSLLLLRLQMSLEQVRRAVGQDEAKVDLFRLLEAEPFSETIVEDTYPDLLTEWKHIGNAMQVPWQYVMIMELSLSAFCAPTAVLFPFPTLRIYPVLWWFLFHPGAFNTSGIIRLYSEAGLLCFLFLVSCILACKVTLACFLIWVLQGVTPFGN